MGFFRKLFGGGEEPDGDEGFRVEIDRSSQKLQLSVLPGWRAVENEPIRATIDRFEDGFVPAAVLMQRAKQVDDGLYAAVELAAQHGVGAFGGKGALLTRIGTALQRGIDPESVVEPLVFFFAALELAGSGAELPHTWQTAVTGAIEDFDAEPLASKPIGFYSWNEPLRRIFRSDRMLQSEIAERDAIERLARAVAGDEASLADYQRYMGLIQRLTNPFPPEQHSLLSWIGQTGPSEGVRVFPASAGPETELVKRLFGGTPIPDDFDLATEIIARIQAGTLSLEPRPESGWYDQQLWSLQPLVEMGTTIEGARFDHDDDYRKHLEALFKAGFALARETHIKQLEIPVAGCAPMRPEKPEVVVTPELSVEPLVTSFLRRADSYRFVRQVLADAFGSDALASMDLQSRLGPRGSLAEALDRMESLLVGAAWVAARELGLDGDAAAMFEGRDGEGAERDFRSWSSDLSGDPLITEDARMMVPVFFDIERKQTKVWAFLGWRPKRLQVSFAQRPTVRVFDAQDQAADDRVTVVFNALAPNVLEPVIKEIYVDRLLDRDELRALCDEHETEKAILAALAP
jgi:hypothetical protein